MQTEFTNPVVWPWLDCDFCTMKAKGFEELDLANCGRETSLARFAVKPNDFLIVIEVSES